jgi:phage tail-like protein
MAVAFAIADPFLTAKFWVEIGGVTEGYFTECTGLSVQTDVLEYAEGGLNDYVHKLPGRSRFSNITLKRGWVESDDLWKWYLKIISGQIETKSVSIILFENKVQSPSEPKARWDISQAYPVKWQGPDFRADSNAVVVETLELAHAGWTRQ